MSGNIVSFFGVFALMAIAAIFSTNRRLISLKLAACGTAIQAVFAAFLFLSPAGAWVFLKFSGAVVKLLNASSAGIAFCFGPLAIPPGAPGSLGFILAIHALPTVVFMTTLMQILYFIGIMPLIVKACARFFTRLMNISGAESLCAASNIFVGIESATTVLPFLKKMTRSELCTVLTAGMATIASSMLVAYVQILKPVFPGIAGHLVSASILSAPAAIVMSKLLLPESEQPETRGLKVEPHYEREGTLMEAAVNGAQAGGRLLLGIIVMLLAFLSLVELANMILGWAGTELGALVGRPVATRLENLLGFVYYPFALAIGVAPADAYEVACLLGQRTILTEVPAYMKLAELIREQRFSDPRSAVLASYALCGFAHMASMAIFVGGISALVPGRTRELAGVAWRALAGATLACLMTAAVAGVFCGGAAPLDMAP